MKIDCKGLDCPEPVIRTKKALEALGANEWLEIEIDSEIVLENVLKFIQYSGLNPELKELENGHIVRVQKQAKPIGQAPQSQPATSPNAILTQESIQIPNDQARTAKETDLSLKVIYLNEDRAGSGEVGQSLLAKLLGSFALLSHKIYAVVCVNTAVQLTTQRSHPAHTALKELQSQGVRVISCGACLQAYGLTDRLNIGEVGNAYEIATLLAEREQITL